MTPQYMTADDASRASALGIELVVDLRGERYQSSGPIGDPPARRYPAGPSNAWGSRAELEAFMTLEPEVALPKVLDIYSAFFTNGVRAIAAQPEGAVLFHCRLGKDRSGVFAALLLTLAGVSEDDVIADYMLTQRDERVMRDFIVRAEAESPVVEARLTAEPVRRTSIEAVLHRLAHEYGGAHGYFERLGVDERILDAAVDSMLEPARPVQP
jgi:protein-tyrosine phosphatase